MRRVITIGFVFALALVASVGFAQDNAELEAAIDAVAAKYMEGWNAGDAAACAATYTGDGEDMELKGLYMNVAVKQGGEWKIHSSRPMVPLPMPSTGT